MSDSTQKTALEHRAQILIKSKLGIAAPSYKILRSNNWLGFIQFYLHEKVIGRVKPTLPDVSHDVCRELIIIDQSKD